MTTQKTRASVRAYDRFEPAHVLALTALLLGIVMLAACNTIEGAGQDIEAAGAAISGTAQDVQEDAP